MGEGGTKVAANKEEGPSYDAFLSYRRSDGTRAAHRLRDDLVTYRLPEGIPTGHPPEPLEVFLDARYERASEDFYESHIKPALLASRTLILVATPDALVTRSDGTPNWVQREIATYLQEREAPRVLVVRAIGEFPGALPEALRDFPNTDVVDLRDPGRWRRLLSEARAQRRDGLLKLLASLYEVKTHDIPLLREEEERRQRRRLVRSLQVAAVVVVALVGLAIWAFSERGRALDALATVREQIIIETALRHPDPLLGALLMAELPDTTTSPGAFAAAVRIAGIDLPYAALPAVDGRISRLPSFSADGTRVAIVSDRQILVASADDGSELARQDVESLFDARLAPDGQTLITLSTEGALVRIGPNGARVHLGDLDVPSEEYYDPPGLRPLTFSPDGHSFALLHFGKLHVGRLEGDELTTLELPRPGRLLGVSVAEGAFRVVARAERELDVRTVAVDAPDFSDRSRPLVLEDDSPPCLAAKLSADGNTLILVRGRRGGDGTYEEWSWSGERWTPGPTAEFFPSGEAEFLEIDIAIAPGGRPATVRSKGLHRDWTGGVQHDSRTLTDGGWEAHKEQDPWVLSPDGRLAAGTLHGEAWVEPHGLRVSSPPVEALGFDATGSKLVTVHANEARIWHLSQSRPTVWSESDLEPEVLQAAFDGLGAGIADHGSTVRLEIDGEDPIELGAASELEYAPYAISHPGARRSTGLGRQHVLVWNWDDPDEPLRLPRPPECDVQGRPEYESPLVFFSASGERVLSYCETSEAAHEAVVDWRELVRGFANRTTAELTVPQRRDYLGE